MTKFDVTMGSSDRTKLCKLVGLYFLNILKSEFGGKNIRLYRDDCLSCFENKLKLEIEKIKKKICKFFRNNELNITIETNLHIAEYLDVTLNLKAGKYYPNRKQHNSLQLAINNKANSIYCRIYPAILRKLHRILIRY